MYIFVFNSTNIVICLSSSKSSITTKIWCMSVWWETVNCIFLRPFVVLFNFKLATEHYRFLPPLLGGNESRSEFIGFEQLIDSFKPCTTHRVF